MTAEANRNWPGVNDERCRGFVPLLELTGRRWVGQIILAGVRGAERFRQYRMMVPGISDRMLSLRLRELEQAGVMERTVVPTMPVTIQYRPTAEGRELLEALQPLINYAARSSLLKSCEGSSEQAG